MFAIAALGVFAFSYHLGNRYARPTFNELTIYVLPQPTPIAPFELNDEQGKPFDHHSLQGFWNLVMAGDLETAACKSLLVRYVLAWNNLAVTPEMQKMTRVVFLNMSREQKAPAELKPAIDFYNPLFTAVDGDDTQRRRFGEQIGISSSALQPGMACDSHNSVVALISPNGYLVALLTGITDPALIARELLTFY